MKTKQTEPQEGVQVEATPKVEDLTTAETDVEIAPETEMPTDETESIESLKAKIAELEDYKARNEEANQKIMDVLDAEPVVAKIIQDIALGASFREAIARHIDIEDLQAAEGDPDFEGWNKNREERAKSLTERRAWEDELDANREMSISEVKAFAEEMKMTPEQMLEFLSNVDELTSNLVRGRIDRKLLGLIKKAVDYDQAVTEAAEVGEVAGKNAKIVTEKITPKDGDGLPKITAADDIEVEKQPKKKGYIERLLADKT